MVRFSLSILFAHRQDEPTPAWKLNFDTINSLLACNVDCTPKGSFRELISSSGGTLGRLVYPARNLLTQLMDQIPSRRPGRGRTTRFRQPLDELGDMVLLEKGRCIKWAGHRGHGIGFAVQARQVRWNEPAERHIIASPAPICKCCMLQSRQMTEPKGWKTGGALPSRERRWFQIAVTIATRAEGPSFGVAPSRTCTWISFLSKEGGSMPNAIARMRT